MRKSYLIFLLLPILFISGCTPPKQEIPNSTITPITTINPTENISENDTTSPDTEDTRIFMGNKDIPQDIEDKISLAFRNLESVSSVAYKDEGNGDESNWSNTCKVDFINRKSQCSGLRTVSTQSPTGTKNIIEETIMTDTDITNIFTKYADNSIEKNTDQISDYILKPTYLRNRFKYMFSTPTILVEYKTEKMSNGVEKFTFTFPDYDNKSITISIGKGNMITDMAVITMDGGKNHFSFIEFNKSYDIQPPKE